jgi:hypothetical protein
MDALFLDLEGTIIEDLDNPNFLAINRRLILDKIAESREVHLFSWAIVNEDDLNKTKWIVEAVEEWLDIKFTSIVFRDDMFSMFRKQFGAIDMIEFNELCNSLGKEFVFQKFIRNSFIHEKRFASKSEIEVTLIDDKVTNTALDALEFLTFARIKTIKV